MNWKTAMHTAKGILSGVGIIAGIAAIARSAAFGRTLADYMVSAGSETYNGIRSQAAQTVSDALGAGMVFYDSVRLLLLFGGVAMICFFGIILADTLTHAPVDVLVDSQGVDTFRRRVAHLAARVARRLDPEGNTEVVHAQEVLPEGEGEALEFASVEVPGTEEKLLEQKRRA